MNKKNKELLKEAILQDNKLIIRKIAIEENLTETDIDKVLDELDMEIDEWMTANNLILSEEDVEKMLNDLEEGIYDESESW